MLSEDHQGGGVGGGLGGSGNSTQTQQRALFTLVEKCIKTLFMLYIETQQMHNHTNTPIYEFRYK